MNVLCWFFFVLLPHMFVFLFVQGVGSTMILVIMFLSLTATKRQIACFYEIVFYVSIGAGGTVMYRCVPHMLIKSLESIYQLSLSALLCC